MFSRALLLSIAAYAAAAPAPEPQVAGYTDADAPYASNTPTPVTKLASSFGLNSQVQAIHTSLTSPAYPLVSDEVTGPTSHGPYEGTPTTTGAVMAPTTLGSEVPQLPPNPTATYYNTDGLLHQPAPVPYQPAGGLGTNGTEPRYQVNSEFDYESLALALYQEVSTYVPEFDQANSCSGLNSIFSTTAWRHSRPRSLPLPG